jgi:hypothetical protein
MTVDQIQQQGVGGKVAFLSHSFENGSVVKIIIIVRTLSDVEKSEKTKTGRLMHVEIKANTLFHILEN